MSNTLVIVESPTKAKTQEIPRKKYTVKLCWACRDLPKSQLGLMLTMIFELKYNYPWKRRNFKELKRS